MIPELAGRLAAGYPELGVCKWRLCTEGDRARRRAEPIAGLGDQREPLSGEPPTPAASTAGRKSGGRSSPERIRKLAERYLRRRADDHSVR